MDAFEGGGVKLRVGGKEKEVVEIYFRDDENGI